MPLTGLQLPQMLKCAWEGRTPRVIQIPYPEGDSFEMRAQESARLAKLQQLRPESKAALLQLFGDDFDIGQFPSALWGLSDLQALLLLYRVEYRVTHHCMLHCVQDESQQWPHFQPAREKACWPLSN